MEVSSGIFVAMALGFLLGLKHATDADHVVAVSTIAREFGNAWRGIWVGASWGLGHTTPLLVLGIIILLLKEAVLDRYEAVAPFFEFGVGVMLVFLGALGLTANRRIAHLLRYRNEGPPQLLVVGGPDEIEIARSEDSRGPPVTRVCPPAVSSSWNCTWDRWPFSWSSDGRSAHSASGAGSRIR